MSGQATKADLVKLETNIDEKIDRAVDDLSEIMETFMFQVDERFNKLEADVADLKQSLDWLTNSIDRLIVKISKSTGGWTGLLSGGR